MARNKTDLPLPDPPTNPNLALKDEREMVEHDMIAKADHKVAGADVRECPARAPRLLIPIEAKKMANNPSSTITRKIDLTTEEVVCSPSDFALPFTLRTSVQRGRRSPRP